MEKKCYDSADQLYQRLKTYFTERSFAAGDRVPAERELAMVMRANRTTLRVALRRMVCEGVLERHVGRGTFFKLSPHTASAHYMLVNTESSPLELLEFRLLLDPQIAIRATTHARDGDIRALARLASLPLLPPDASASTLAAEIERIDIRFHAALAELAGNKLLCQTYSIISTVRQKPAHGQIHAKLWHPDHWRAQQRRIVEAMATRQIAAVREEICAKLRHEQSRLMT